MIRKGLIIASLLILSVAVVWCYAQKAASDVNKDYMISADDILDIAVYGESDLSTTLRVSQDGTINYPLLGNVRAAGFTVRELEKQLEELLGEDYLVYPQVNVFIKEYTKISILGAVKSPGAYQMKEKLTLTQAVAMAGGFLDTADTTKVKITRITDNKKETKEVNVDQILNKAAADIEIRGNDTIIVEEYGRISIMGQIARPGVYALQKNLTAVEAISLAGGVTSTAAQNRTRVIRIKDGEKKIIDIPVNDIMKGTNTSKDILLEPGDTIVVPESFF